MRLRTKFGIHVTRMAVIRDGRVCLVPSYQMLAESGETQKQ